MLILRPEQIQLMRLGLPVIPCNGGDGGSSSSSTSSSTSTTHNTTNVDRRQVVDTGSVGVSSDTSTVYVSVLDQGAIQGAKEAIQSALTLVQASDQETGRSVSSVLGFAKDVFNAGVGVIDKAGQQIKQQTELVAKAYDASDTLIAKAYDDARGEGTQKNMIAAAALATVAIVAIKVWGK